MWLATGQARQAILHLDAEISGAGMSSRRKLSDARRRQILKAAVQVIADKGLCDTGIKDRDRLVELVRCSCSVGEAEDDFDEWVLWLDLWARAPRDPDVARDRLTMDRRWRTTIGQIVREGQTSGEFALVDVDAFALRLAALIDGLAILVVLRDPEVTRDRMFDLCMDTCAKELGFPWTSEDRAAIIHAASARAPDGRAAG
jgi:hypothetical protein